MQLFWASLGTALLLAAAAFVHLRIPRFTAAGRVAALRAILVATGLGFALATALVYTGSLPTPLVVLSAFGLVHVPAALILLLKGERGEGRT